MDDNNNYYIFASEKSWNFEAFIEIRAKLPGEWVVCTTPHDLRSAISRLSPRYAFFPHWSHIVDDSLLDATECVCFHMTDLPYGRGGSPLQNLIVRGHTETMISALRMTSVLDGGPIYAKRSLDLSGTATEIFERSSQIILELIAWIAATEPTPMKQIGEPTVFTRREPSESLLSGEIEPDKLYDHIRMLDAPSYPHAYIDHGRWRIEFTNAKSSGNEVTANTRFRLRDDYNEG